jgi:hypothetical protein
LKNNENKGVLTNINVIYIFLDLHLEKGEETKEWIETDFMHALYGIVVVGR